VNKFWLASQPGYGYYYFQPRAGDNGFIFGLVNYTEKPFLRAVQAELLQLGQHRPP
jgi:hypothetical protein